MNKYLIILSLFISSISFGQTVFINELHYDNTGGDVGEGFEIAGPAGTDLSCFDIILYNGATGAGYETINLSGTIPDEGCGYGAINFTPTGSIQNGAPDGICLYNSCTSTVIQFLSYEGSFTATAGVANGLTSTDIGVNETSGTPVGSSLQLTGTGQTYGDFTWQSPATASTGSINSGQDFCVGCAGLDTEPTAEATGNSVPTIGCTSATIEWTLPTDATDVIIVVSTGAITDTPTDGVAYTASPLFGSGDELIVSDAQYVVYNGSGTSVNVSNLSPSTTYNYAIFGYNGAQANCEENYLTGGVFSSFTTDATCSTPQISSIMYNSCNGTAEGTDELIVFQMGDDAIPVDSITLELPNSTWCNVGCGTNIILNNSTYVNDLNTMAGCALFVYQDPIPAGATVIVFTGNPPSTVLDYSSNCGAAGAPFYVLFMDNSSTTGNFANFSSGPRDLVIHFGSGISDSVSYIGTDGVGNTDGATVNFDVPGNPTYIESVGCVYPLSISLSKFAGFENGNSNLIQWTTSSEMNSSHFEIHRSSDGVNFEKIGQVRASENSSEIINYSFEDHEISSENYYYKLKMFNLDNTYTISKPIQITREIVSVYYADGSIWVGFKNQPNKTYTLNIFDLSGTLAYQENIEGDLVIPWSKSGFFIVEIEELGIRQKILCNQ